MATGERIKYIRNLRGLTQRELGEKIGFSGRTADVRIAQYESEKRMPKADLMAKLANALEVVPEALDVPNIDDYYGLIHTLFALEDTLGLTIRNIDGKLCLTLEEGNHRTGFVVSMLIDWVMMKNKLRSGEITKEDYNEWRLNYKDSSLVNSEVKFE